MKVDCLVAEIGSTTTTVNAFNIYDECCFLGKGVSDTSVETDVREGLNRAIDDLKKNMDATHIEFREMFASSSAAGGLRMTVSGLVYEMTVRAAKEAALNAGANIHLITAGSLEDDDLKRIETIRPNIILVAGGTDYGDKDIAFDNLRRVEQLALNVPLIYAGNIDNHERIKRLFDSSTQKAFLKIVENVYPRVDFLNILPLRKVIYETFEEHIVHAKGMKHIKEMVNGSIMPTPGSVMESVMLLHETLGNILVIDVGGATTDVHSVTTPSEEFKSYAEGEPLEKRTVEGDLGVFINRKNVLRSMDEKKIQKRLGIDEIDYEDLLNRYNFIPRSEPENKLVYEIARTCAHRALDRHVGDIKKVYTSNGIKMIPEGKDLTQVHTIILTGGALIYLDNTEEIIREYLNSNPTKLIPSPQTKIIKDHDYLLSSIGVLSLKHPEAARKIIRKSLNL